MSYIFQEIKAYCDYHLLSTPCYWRSKSQFEVDFVFEDMAVEVKAKQNIGCNDLKGLRAFREEGWMRRHIVVCMEPIPRTVSGIEIVPWEMFLGMLWDQGELYV